MTEAKHTPGPWVIEYDNCDAGTCQWYLVGPAKVEVSYNLTALQDEEWKANALLIAAAPELLEALQRIMDDMDSEFGTDYDYNKARAAIAKAIGN